MDIISVNSLATSRESGPQPLCYESRKCRGKVICFNLIKLYVGEVHDVQMIIMALHSPDKAILLISMVLWFPTLHSPTRLYVFCSPSTA